MNLKNSIYRVKKNISPFKTAVIAVIISVIASVTVSVISDVGKTIISNEMKAMGFNGMSAISYNYNGDNSTDINFYKDISELKCTENITPVIYDNGVIKFPNNSKLNVMSWGINKEAQNVIDLDIINGRMISQEDIDSSAFVCLIDEDIAKKIYKRTNICGKKIRVTIGDNNIAFTIIGTIKKGSNILNTLIGDVMPNFIYMPYTTMKNLSPKPNFDHIVFTKSESDITQEEINKRLINLDDTYRYRIIKLTDLSHQKEQINNIADTAFMALYIVSCVAVLVCSIAVASNVNTAVIARKKDIGIKMSMGASRLNITVEFLFSAILSCVIGIIIALTVVFIVISIIQKYIPFNITHDYSLILLSIFATIILTTVFSLIPSYKAATMAPIKALNRE